MSNAISNVALFSYKCVYIERERECILKAQVPDVSMRPPLCTDADDLLRCSATVENLGERGEPDILIWLRHWDLLRALRTG